MVPGAGNPQALNRYADPNGHRSCGGHYDPACLESQDENELGDFAEIVEHNITPIRWVGSFRVKQSGYK